MARTKPYSRRTNSDGPGAWSNDLFDPTPSPSHTKTGPSLLARITDLPSSKSTTQGKRGAQHRGKELLGSSTPSSVSSGAPRAGMYSDAPLVAKRGVELFPDSKRRRSGPLTDALVDRSSLLGRALGGVGPQRTGRERVRRSVSGSGAQKGRELLPSGSGGAAAGGAYGAGARGQELLHDRPAAHGWTDGPVVQMGIHGHARPVSTSVWVRVDHLAQGTTPEDVMSAFSPAPILSATLAPSPSSSAHAPTISVLLEFASPSPAEAVCAAYDGALADGNELRVYKTEAPRSEGAGVGLGEPVQAQVQAQRGLRERLRAGTGTTEMEVDLDRPAPSGRAELLPSSGSSRMYADALDPPLPLSATSFGDAEPSRAQRASAWASVRSAPVQRSLAERVGNGRR